MAGLVHSCSADDQRHRATNSTTETFLFSTASLWNVLHTDDERTKFRLRPRRDPRTSAVSNDSRFVAIASWEGGGAEVWDARSGEKVANLDVGRHGVLQFSPDSRLFAATPDGVTLWRTDNWQWVHRLHAQGTTPTGLGIAFSPDNRVLAVGQINGVISLRNPQTGAEWARLSHRDQAVASVMAFSADQCWLVTLSMDEWSPAQVWDITSLRRVLLDRGLDWPAEVLAATARPSSGEGPLEVVVHDEHSFSLP